MSDEKVLWEPIAEVAIRLQRGDLSPLELTQLTLKRIERLNPRLRAFIHYGGGCLEEARQSESRFRRKEWLGPLDGIPVSLKDLIDARGFPTTAGSKVFGSGRTPRRDATAVARLRRAGAVFVGKTNLHEFAYGVTNENHHYGAAINPWDPNRVSGGSSGGSAVSVATGMSFGSLGTDTRGSIRIPSACCGTVGLKPTIGRIPTTGVIPLSWTLDHVGPMARSVQDVALMYQALAPSRKEPDLLQTLRRKPRGFTLGICDYYLDRVEPQIAAAVGGSVELLQASGLKIKKISIGLLDEALWASGVIASTEALAYHEPLMEQSCEGYDPAVLERLRKGLSLTGVESAKAMRIRVQVAEEFRKAFQECDCLVGATIPAAPPRLGENFLEMGEARGSVVKNMVRLCTPQNMAGIPSLSLPCGFRDNGLPIGLQLIAWRRRESVLLQLGAYFQTLTDWHLRHPPVKG